MASWNAGEPSVVTATWSLSATDYASIDAEGTVTNRNATTTDQTVTLTASYTAGGVTKTASKTITLAKRTLVSIVVTGDDEIPGSGTAAYVCTATWSDGATSVVTPAWRLSASRFGSVDATGNVTNENIYLTDVTMSLIATFTSDGKTDVD